jgi:hypothetical protein
MNTTELTVTEEMALVADALPDDIDLTVAGEENLQPGDLGMPPRLRISQPNRPVDGTNPGDIVNTLTGAVCSQVEFVPMVFLPTTRVMWPATFNADNQPVCVSDDNRSPTDDLTRVTNPQRGPCAECPYSQFGEDGTPPVCKAQRNFLILTLPDLEPAILTMQSTGIASAKQLTSLAKMAGLRKSITMAARQVQDNRGMWYVPAFVMGRKLSVTEIITAAEFRDDLKNLVITADIVVENGHQEPGEDEYVESGEPVPSPLYEEEVPF